MTRACPRLQHFLSQLLLVSSSSFILYMCFSLLRTRFHRCRENTANTRTTAFCLFLPFPLSLPSPFPPQQHTTHISVLRPSPSLLHDRGGESDDLIKVGFEDAVARSVVLVPFQRMSLFSCLRRKRTDEETEGEKVPKLIFHFLENRLREGRKEVRYIVDLCSRTHAIHRNQETKTDCDRPLLHVLR